MTAHHFVERTSQPIASTPPSPDLLEAKDRGATELDRVEVLVDDGVPPMIQFFENLHSGCISRIMDLDLIPESDVEPTEVRADAAGLSIAPIQEATSSHLVSYQLLECRWRRDRCENVSGTLAMKVSTKPLELRCEQHGIGLIELLRVEPLAASRSADGRVS
jgi:hypothetical protein